MQHWSCRIYGHIPPRNFVKFNEGYGKTANGKKNMKRLTIAQYVGKFLKQFGFGQLTVCVYQFIGDNMD